MAHIPRTRPVEAGRKDNPSTRFQTRHFCHRTVATRPQDAAIYNLKLGFQFISKCKDITCSIF
jgi:hypothetical protein